MFKKYNIYSQDGCAEYEAYYKGRISCNHIKPRNYDEIVRIVPAGEGWSIPTGLEGTSLGQLVDNGDSLVIYLGDKKIKLDYYQVATLENLLRIQAINSDWENDLIREEVWEPGALVREYYKKPKEPCSNKLCNDYQPEEDND